MKYAMIVLLAIGLVAGCSNKTEAPASQFTEQPTQQEQATFGGHSVTLRWNQTGGNPIDGAGSDFPLTEAPYVELDGFDDGQTKFAAGRSTYLQINHLTLNTGATTTPSATQEANASGANTPAADATQAPETTLSAPLALGAPGSAPTANSTAAGRGQADQTASTTNDLATQLANLKAQDPAAFTQLFDWLSGAAKREDPADLSTNGAP